VLWKRRENCTFWLRHSPVLSVRIRKKIYFMHVTIDDIITSNNSHVIRVPE
jgi:hypothetical protein